MEEFVEADVRRLVAHCLGVGIEELVSEVSLRDDLAADSLDLVELAMALEAEFAIVVPEPILDRVRTYGDLVHATGVLIRTRCEAEARGAERPLRIWARITPPGGGSAGILERTGWLSPYSAETVAEDALRAGRGARLEVTVAASTTAGFARVQQQFAGLGKRGVQVIVRRDDRPHEPPVQSTVDRVVERHELAAAGAEPPLNHRLLDELTGARTTVTLTNYVGDDPWQADSAGAAYRAASGGHHVHADFDRPPGGVPPVTRNIVDKTPTHLQFGPPDDARHARYYQTHLYTEVGSRGERNIWREATYYSQDRVAHAFAIGSSMMRLAGHSPGRQEGLRAQFDLAAPSPNGFRARTATLVRAGEEDTCTLLIIVSAQVGGAERFAEVALRRGAESTMHVRLVPPQDSSGVGLVASP